MGDARSCWGPLGAIGFRDRPMFDDKIMMAEGYQYVVVKDGPKWRTKVSNYFISRAPLLKEVIDWAE